jgi:hypothetical protein
MNPTDTFAMDRVAVLDGGEMSTSRTSAWLVPIFVVALFVSAFLLFLVQPMIAKMVLPILGGAPMVWNACMVFFQITLLAGYGYAHCATRWLTRRAQIAVHIGVLLLPFAVLPVLIRRDHALPPDGNPVGWLLALLAITIGLPFFVLSTTASVLQHWFSKTGHRAARDPYFLYMASNLGSFLALAAYPFVVEPLWAVGDQSQLWTTGYAGFVVLMVACAAVTWRDGVPLRPERQTVETIGTPTNVSWRDRSMWIAFAFAPSSLMLAVTSYLSTDIAAVPLMWTIPLGLYLLTFVVAFSSVGPPVTQVAQRLFALLIVAMMLMISTDASMPLALMFPLHLLTFAAAASLCHGRLAIARPQPAHLTEFYLWISVGGVLGGLFNTLVAPVAFDAIVEYPIVLVLTCLLMAPAVSTDRDRDRVLDIAVPAGLAAVTAILIATLTAKRLPLQTLNIVMALPVIAAFTQRRRPLRFGLSLGAVVFASVTFAESTAPLLYAERTFFGVYRVTNRQGNLRTLMHGTTLHGMEAHSGPDKGEPLTYFHRQGPVGQAFAAIPSARTGREIGVAGLGVGTLAAYATPGQQWTFYEIDAEVEHIARNAEHFTFLARCADRCRTVIGDARLSLERAAGVSYDLLILDAFSSDSIPMHLLTREALGLYLDRLAPTGALLFHISNRHLSLGPMLASLAADRNLVGVMNVDYRQPGWPANRNESIWVALARRPSDLGALMADARWQPLGASPLTAWSDDFSNILSVLGAPQ